MSEKEIHQLQKDLTELREEFTALKEMLQPFADAIKVINKVGSWSKGFLKGLILILTVISLIIGIIFAIKKGGS